MKISKARVGAYITALPALFAIASPYLSAETVDILKQLWEILLPIGLGLGIHGIRDKQERDNQEQDKGDLIGYSNGDLDSNDIQ